uniref:NAD(+) kinase n=1 Tax=Macrostomum lignano TaxID=282301 RepID=A0A1I8FMT6_9PLAT
DGKSQRHRVRFMAWAREQRPQHRASVQGAGALRQPADSRHKCLEFALLTSPVGCLQSEQQHLHWLWAVRLGADEMACELESPMAQTVSITAWNSAALWRSGRASDCRLGLPSQNEKQPRQARDGVAGPCERLEPDRQGRRTADIAGVRSPARQRLGRILQPRCCPARIAQWSLLRVLTTRPTLAAMATSLSSCRWAPLTCRGQQGEVVGVAKHAEPLLSDSAASTARWCPATCTPLAAIDWADALVSAGGDGTFLLAASRLLNPPLRPFDWPSTPIRESQKAYLCMPTSKTAPDAIDALLCWRSGQPSRWRQPPAVVTPKSTREYRFSEHYKELEEALAAPAADACKCQEHELSPLPVLALNEVFIGRFGIRLLIPCSRPINAARGVTDLIRVRSRMWDARLVIDGDYAFSFNDGCVALLEMRPEDAICCPY